MFAGHAMRNLLQSAPTSPESVRGDQLQSLDAAARTRIDSLQPVTAIATGRIAYPRKPLLARTCCSSLKALARSHSTIDILGIDCLW